MMSRKKLFQTHIPFAHFMARLFANRRWQYAPLEDMGQDALFAMWRASRRFDRSRGLVFRTYAGRAIWNALSGAATVAARNGFTRVGGVASRPLGGESLDAESGREDADPLESAELWAAVERLPKATRRAVVAYYRDGDSSPVIASREGVCKEAARQRIAHGVKLLRDRYAETTK